MSIELKPLRSVQTSKYFEACEEDDPSAIERCIRNGADPMAVDALGRNGLHIALQKRYGWPRSNVIHFLAQRYPSLLEGLDPQGKRPITYLIENVRLTHFFGMVEDTNPALFDTERKRDVLGIFKSILSKKDASYHDSRGNNIFHLMAGSPTFSERSFIQVAWEYVRKLSIPLIEQWSTALKTDLLSYIPIFPLTDVIVSYLTTGKGDDLLSVQNSAKQTPIHIATGSFYTHPDVIQILQSGVDPKLKDRRGRSVKDAIEEWESERITRCERIAFKKGIEMSPELSDEKMQEIIEQDLD